MRRLFYQTKLYDYSSIKECTKHINEMEKRGWKIKVNIYENGQTEYPYSVEFYKEV